MNIEFNRQWLNEVLHKFKTEWCNGVTRVRQGGPGELPFKLRYSYEERVSDGKGKRNSFLVRRNSQCQDPETTKELARLARKWYQTRGRIDSDWRGNPGVGKAGQKLSRELETWNNAVSVKITGVLCRKCITQGPEWGRVPESSGKCSRGETVQPDQGRELQREKGTILFCCEEQPWKDHREGRGSGLPTSQGSEVVLAISV